MIYLCFSLQKCRWVVAGLTPLTFRFCCIAIIVYICILSSLSTMASTAAIQGVSFLKLIFQMAFPLKVNNFDSTDEKAKMCLRDGSLCTKYCSFSRVGIAFWGTSTYQIFSETPCRIFVCACMHHHLPSICLAFSMS